MISSCKAQKSICEDQRDQREIVFPADTADGRIKGISEDQREQRENISILYD
ncbi:hypothetical protein [Lunatibacter salilacus]|uniref:hypothetical protein n=1 Tax=Lunatibacter salilacus TaxID=2483804 RepID=UPI00131DAFCD|nr:hypothetical protein [Lunatibacter salilacus]